MKKIEVRVFSFMAVPKNFLACLCPEGIYHVYNRTNNKEPLFHSEANKLFFLQRYELFVQPFVTTYAFSLLNNHFHLLIRVNSQESIVRAVKRVLAERLTDKEKQLLANPDADCSCNYFLEWQFLRFFTSYSMSFNRVHKRKGNLFHKPFKRVLIEKDNQFTSTLLYIHLNPVKHGLVECASKYQWSSLAQYLTGVPGLVNTAFGINWFGGLKRFEETHKSAEFFVNLQKGFAF